LAAAAILLAIASATVGVGCSWFTFDQWAKTIAAGAGVVAAVSAAVAASRSRDASQRLENIAGQANEALSRIQLLADGSTNGLRISFETTDAGVTLKFQSAGWVDEVVRVTASGHRVPLPLVSHNVVRADGFPSPLPETDHGPEYLAVIRPWASALEISFHDAANRQRWRRTVPIDELSGFMSSGARGDLTEVSLMDGAVPVR
jgi:hypothetical protein